VSAPVAMAFGGSAPLQGNKLVRFVFLDEGGISKHEPFAVVAGIFVHADEKLVLLENELERLKLKHIPEEYRDGFIFHATDIWSGGGKLFKDRARWPLDKRIRILRDLARIPRKLDIPIVYSSIDKNVLRLAKDEAGTWTSLSGRKFDVHSHAVSFGVCTALIERVMRQKWPDEVAQLVVEDNSDARLIIKLVHQILRNPRIATAVTNAIVEVLPLTKIRGSPHFATKAESHCLQLADTCAFVVRGHLTKHPHNPVLYRAIRSMILEPLDLEYLTDGPAVTVSPPWSGN
jgi:Protein of unknown function (DUF3800)